MEHHRKYIRNWLIRSRVVAILGALIFLPVVFVPELFTGFYKGVLALFGLSLILLGVLDGFGVFNRRRRREAYDALQSEKRMGR